MYTGLTINWRYIMDALDLKLVSLIQNEITLIIVALGYKCEAGAEPYDCKRPCEYRELCSYETLVNDIISERKLKQEELKCKK
jgi:hypothetical protein